jgi:hypothetical protein
VKRVVLFLAVFCYLTPCFAQSEIRDSVFVRLDRIKAKKLSYDVKDGNLRYVAVLIKNKYESLTSFVAIKNNADLALINKKDVDRRKVLVYNKFNERLNRNFLDVLFYTKIYFVMSESQDSYLVLWVQPLLPGPLNKH